jgi:uncharacterized protein YecA (UPF0149 family)
MQVSTDARGLRYEEVFVGNTKAEVFGKMDQRRAELEAEGHTGFQRMKVARNVACPCGSGRKFKKCCIDKAR